VSRGILILAFLLAGCTVYGPEGENDGCVTCHGGPEELRDLTGDGIPDEGIEPAHREANFAPGRCSVCHGGDPTSTKKDTAHVPVPDNWAAVRGEGRPAVVPGYIRNFAPNQLDAMPKEYVQFINPGDMRVLDTTCGTAGCHEDKAATLASSVMTTNIGHYWPTLFLAGRQGDRTPHHASFAVEDPNCDPEDETTVCELVTLEPPNAQEMALLFAGGLPEEGDLLELAYRHYLSKNCGTCHQAGFPRNNSAGLYRSTGCTSCHMVYGEDGLYEGNDPTLPRASAPHPKQHTITTAIPSEQCASCHFQGGRIGLLYRGIREGGFSASQTPEFAERIDKGLYGHASGYYITDEDTRNDIDETPPDIHYQRGMECADCHVGRDVHGDGKIYRSSKHQVSIRCEDCHGTVREAVAEDAEGRFMTQEGTELTHVRREGDQVVLRGFVSGQDHVMPQVVDLLAEGGGGSPRMREAMAPNEAGWSHTDSLTCDTCHTNHMQMCIGCHVSLDLRINQIDYQTGLSTPGLTRGSRTTYSLDHVLLGTGRDGKVQSVAPSQQVQMAILGSEELGTEDGQVLHGTSRPDGEGGERVVGRFRHAQGSQANLGFSPFVQHTTTSNAKTCDACHRKNESPEELARVRGVYGFGTGEFMLEGDEGEMVDGLQFLTEDGTPLTTWAHPGSGPVEVEKRDRALGVILPATP
jgi:hypothetical protein